MKKEINLPILKERNLIKIGTSAGLILPKDCLKGKNKEIGDTIYMISDNDEIRLLFNKKKYMKIVKNVHKTLEKRND